MSEQFIKGYAVDVSALAVLVGSKDGKLLGRMKRRRGLFDEIGELLEEWGESLSVEQVVDEIVAGKLAPKHAYEYRRVLQLVAQTIGAALRPNEVVLPGRGWHELGPAWSHWGLSAWAKKWTSPTPWPWPEKPKGGRVNWPVALLVHRSEIAALDRELKTFDPSVILERGVPRTVDRFGTGEWDVEDLSIELEHLSTGLAKWLAGARAKSSDLLVWIDGQQ